MLLLIQMANMSNLSLCQLYVAKLGNLSCNFLVFLQSHAGLGARRVYSPHRRKMNCVYMFAVG